MVAMLPTMFTCGLPSVVGPDGMSGPCSAGSVRVVLPAQAAAAWAGRAQCASCERLMYTAVSRVKMYACRTATKISNRVKAVSYTHLRAHETRHDIVCRLLLEKKKT